MYSQIDGNLSKYVLCCVTRKSYTTSRRLFFTNRCAGVAIVNDGERKIEQLLELICRLSSTNVEAVKKLETRKCSLSPTDDIEDPLVLQERK